MVCPGLGCGDKGVGADTLYLPNTLEEKLSRTRKSSCVNARGIPYQVLHMLSYPPGGVGTLAGGGGGRYLGVPPPPQCGQTENITFPILRMRSVIIWFMGSVSLNLTQHFTIL